MEKRNQNLQQLKNRFKNTTTQKSEQIQNIVENGKEFVHWIFSCQLSIGPFI